MEEKQLFTESFKRSIVDMVNCGAISKEEARRTYGIKGKSVILLWQLNFQKYGRCSLNLGIDPIRLKELKPTQPLKPAEPETSQDELKARIRQLERQLEDEQLRSEAYNRMIDIAEKELKISIRKKSNTK
jgi:hypothetical protein